ncbi:MAG: type III-B CRISPR module RAMP protein Cmr1, partial [Campylobacteraceae bacterium]|nr:type III-B CRISPR module RAMP protein Cmr1 [Campylobacteraceae bacterium]
MNISRFVNVKNELIRCEAEFVTPSFLGGAEQNAQLRTPPFKAALRWWWRVLFGWQYGSEIYEAESKLFGSTDSASKVRIEVIGKLSAQSSNSFGGKDIQVTSKGRKFPIDVIDYLAYGLYDYSKDRHGNIYKRDHFAANSRFTLDVCMPKDKEQEIILCLKALFTFGGVGSRSRNGFGSLRLTNNA